MALIHFIQFYSLRVFVYSSPFRFVVAVICLRSFGDVVKKKGVFSMFTWCTLWQSKLNVVRANKRERREEEICYTSVILYCCAGWLIRSFWCWLVGFEWKACRMCTLWVFLLKLKTKIKRRMYEKKKQEINVFRQKSSSSRRWIRGGIRFLFVHLINNIEC